MARSRPSTHSACLNRQDCRAAFSSQELKSTSGTADEQSGGQERQLTSRGTLLEGATDAGCLERQAPAAGPTLITGPAPSARAVPEPARTSSSPSLDHRRKYNAKSYSGRAGIWKLSCCMGCPLGHEAAHDEIDPRFNGGRQPLTVSGQAPVAHEPCAMSHDVPGLQSGAAETLFIPGPMAEVESRHLDLGCFQVEALTPVVARSDRASRQICYIVHDRSPYALSYRGKIRPDNVRFQGLLRPHGNGLAEASAPICRIFWRLACAARR